MAAVKASLRSAWVMACPLMCVADREENAPRTRVSVDACLTYALCVQCMKITDRPDLLATFVRIAETGSLTAAARSLELSQPSV
ncbi:MAG: LysR family transcriptional regulator, partial [Pseudomonadota bacterium]